MCKIIYPQENNNRYFIICITTSYISTDETFKIVNWIITDISNQKNLKQYSTVSISAY